MFSGVLYILDRNTERFMGDELKRKVDSLRQGNDSPAYVNSTLTNEIDTLTGENTVFPVKMLLCLKKTLHL